MTRPISVTFYGEIFKPAVDGNILSRAFILKVSCHIRDEEHHRHSCILMRYYDSIKYAINYLDNRNELSGMKKKKREIKGRFQHDWSHFLYSLLNITADFFFAVSLQMSSSLFDKTCLIMSTLSMS